MQIKTIVEKSRGGQLTNSNVKTLILQKVLVKGKALFQKK